ncbi:non-heme iron oxygenase ferredoxin subunit [Ramlibacter sp.]|uniref:non-heme iron oxygenase ferredoxin subunit n=1 Tax=Ramlibacter sp. TaxID=1917967 RepID=UPI003D09CC11
MAWHRCAKHEDIWDGGVLGVVAEGVPIALYRIDGNVYATSNICTHATAAMSDGFLEGDCIECPLHQAVFHVPTGEVRGGPADEPLKTYPVRVEGDDVLVDLDPA